MKIFEDFNFKKHNAYNIEEIKKNIDSFSTEWTLNTHRQDAYPVHKDTNSYFLYTANLNWKIGENFFVEETSKDKKLMQLVEPIIKNLEEIHKGERGNVLLIKLKTGQDVLPHKDSGDYLMLSRRHHIPIVTSSDVSFFVGDESVNMYIGECWEINNSRTHSVSNSSEIDRVHLLIDIMPNIEIGKK
jgi:hypothetical protein